MGGLTLPGHFSYKELDRRDSVVKEGEYLGTNSGGYMDVGDESVFNRVRWRIARWSSIMIAQCHLNPTYVRTIARNKMFPWCRIIKMNLTMNFELTLEWPWMNERDWTWIIMNQTDFFWIWWIGANPGCLNLPRVKQPG